jgi:hypothetical protein
MSQEGTQPVTGEGQQNVQAFLDERDMRTVFANGFRVHTNPEEVIVDVMFTMPNPQQNPQQPSVLVKASDRVVMSYGTAKRLAASLQQLIRRYEQQFGEIPMQGPQPRR